MGSAAEAEAQRRVILAAIALKRFHLREGCYPKSLAELTPTLLPNPLVDFIDGQPLRYRPVDAGHFVVYSIGLDGADNGGISPQLKTGGPFSLGAYQAEEYQSPAAKAADIIWPTPASVGEMAAFAEAKKMEAATQAADMEDRQAAAHWDFTERRQRGAERLLADNPSGVTNGVMYQGRLLVSLLRNREAARTNKLSLAELLTLHPITTGDEPETVSFEVPLAFDALAKVGSLQLLVDPMNESDSEGGVGAIQFECKRAGNGNCLIAWSTLYECPGLHALQVWLELNEPDESGSEICGPLLRATVTNLCQFTPACAGYDPEVGAIFHAKLEDQNGRYVIDMTDTNGVHLKTISGTTTNGVVKERWNLFDERAIKFTNGAFNCIFDLTLPDSGRRQRLRL